MKSKDESIDNLKRLKKDFIREKKELTRKYFELVQASNEEYINIGSKYKVDDLVLVKSDDQLEFYKIVKLNTALNYSIDNEEYFDYFFIKEKITETNLIIYYSCQKFQKNGILGKRYYNIYDNYNDHIKIGECKDYTPSKIRNLFGMSFDHMFQETINIHNMKNENSLNLELDAPNETVREALLKFSTNNRKLQNFINKVFRENKDMEICAWDDYGWEWDIECHGGEEGAEIAICNHDFRDDEHYEGDGWEMFDAPEVFSNYFHDFNWSDITLDNGKILLLIDADDHLAFQIVDNEKMEDGKVDWNGITW